MGKDTADTPVGLGIAAFRTGQQDVEHQEGKQNGKHANELQHGCGGNEAVFLPLHRLNQGSKHHANAEVIADVGEVYVEIPADQIDVVEDTEACDEANNTQRAIDSLKNQLRSSVSDHKEPLFPDGIQFKSGYRDAAHAAVLRSWTSPGKRESDPGILHRQCSYPPGLRTHIWIFRKTES